MANKRKRTHKPRVRAFEAPPPNCVEAKTRSLQSLLPYWHISDGVVFNRSGRGEIAFRIQPPAASSMGYEDLVGFLQKIKTALRAGSKPGKRMRLYFRVQPSEGPSLEGYNRLLRAKEPALAEIGRLRSEQLMSLSKKRGFYAYDYVVTLEVGAPRTMYRSANPLIIAASELLPFLKRKNYVPFTPSEYLEWLNEVEMDRYRLRAVLEMAGMKVEPLHDEELFRFIFEYLNPGIEPPRYAPAVLPSENTDFDPAEVGTTLRDRLVRTSIDNRRLERLRLGDTFVRLYHLADVPPELEFGSVQAALFAVEPPYLLVLDFEQLDSAAASSRLRKIYTDRVQDARVGDMPSPEADEGSQQAYEMLRRIASTGEGVFRVGVRMLLFDEGEEGLERRHNELLSATGRLVGTPFLPLDRGALSPWLETLPLSGFKIKGTKLYIETDAARFWPWRAPWRYMHPEPVEVYRTHWNTVVGINVYDHGAVPNSHAIIAGGSGSGKSFLVQARMIELLKTGDAIAVAIDEKPNSYDGMYRLFAERGLATRVHFGPASDTVINPFDLPEGATEPDEVKRFFLEALLNRMVPPSEDPTIGAIEEAIKSAAISQVYAQAVDEIETEEGEIERVFTGVTMSDYVRALSQLNVVGGRALNEREREIAQSLATRFERWTKTHPRGRLFDGKTTVPIDDAVRFVYFVVEHGETVSDLFPITILTVADLTWRIVHRSRYARKLVVFEEAWALLQDERSASFVHSFFRAGRTLGVAAWAVSQSLTDFTGEHAAAILNNVSHTVLLRTEDPMSTKRAVLPGVPENLLDVPLPRPGENGRNALFWLKGATMEEGDIVRIEVDPLSYWTFTTRADEARRRNELAKQLGSFHEALRVLAGYQNDGIAGRIEGPEANVMS